MKKVDFFFLPAAAFTTLPLKSFLIVFCVTLFLTVDGAVSSFILIQTCSALNQKILTFLNKKFKVRELGGLDGDGESRKDI